MICIYIQTFVIYINFFTLCYCFVVCIKKNPDYKTFNFNCYVGTNCHSVSICCTVSTLLA